MLEENEGEESASGTGWVPSVCVARRVCVRLSVTHSKSRNRGRSQCSPERVIGHSSLRILSSNTFGTVEDYNFLKTKTAELLEVLNIRSLWIFRRQTLWYSF